MTSNCDRKVPSYMHAVIHQFGMPTQEFSHSKRLCLGRSSGTCGGVVADFWQVNECGICMWRLLRETFWLV